MEKIIIAGGTGTIGSEITKILIQKGYEPVVLSRTQQGKEGKLTFAHWHPEKNELDEAAVEGATGIINLAGANLANGRWTKERKKIIVESRVQSVRFLIKKIQELKLPVKSFISASAIGYYGAQQNEHSFQETDLAGNDFLANVCIAWEKATADLATLPVRNVIFRIGLVLSDNGGMFQKILPMAQKGINVCFGSGNQIYPWIHVSDVAEAFVFAMENEKLSGVYNLTVAESAQVTQRQFNRLLAQALNRRGFLPNAPAFLIKLFLGEMAEMVLNGAKIDNHKLKVTGFKVKYPDLENAIRELLARKN